MSKGFSIDGEVSDGRYSKRSIIAARNRDHERRWGPFLRQDEWSIEEDSLLMECFLVHEFPLIGDKSMVNSLKRTYRAVDTRLYKIAVRYPGLKHPDIDRTNRTGLVISERDRVVIGLATGPGGKKYGALAAGFHYLAAVLSRSMKDAEEAVYSIMEGEVNKVSKVCGFAVEDKKYSTDPERVIEVVGSALSKESTNFVNRWKRQAEASTEA